MRRTLLMAVSMAATGVAIAAAGAPAIGATNPSPDVEAARQVTSQTNPTRLIISPQIAVDPQDPLTMAVVAPDARGGACSLQVSQDGGLTWTTTAQTLLPEDLPYCVQNDFGPAAGIGFASNGRLYVGMSAEPAQTHTGHGPVTPLIAVTDDLGKTVHTYPVAEPKSSISFTDAKTGKTVTGAYEYLRLDTLAVDPKDPNTVYRGYRYQISGVPSTASKPLQYLTQPAIAVSHDGGKTWGAPVQVLANYQPFKDGTITGGGAPALVVAPDGTAYGFLTGSPKSVPDNAPQPKAPMLMFKSTDGGKTWVTSQISAGQIMIDDPTAAVDPSNGTLYLAWAQRGDSEKNFSNIYVSASTNAGKSWSTPLNIVDDSVRDHYNQYFPGISVAPNGRVDVAWTDFRNDPFFVPGGDSGMGGSGNERYADVYLASSTDGGRIFSPDIRMTDRSIDYNVGATFNSHDIRGPMGIASSNYAALVTWPDSRAGNADFEAEDAYFTRARFGTPPALAGSSTGNGDTMLAGFLGAGAALAFAGILLLAFMLRRGSAGRTGTTPATASARK